MKADQVFSPSEVAYVDLTGKVAVVIDVLRFTTTALTAIENGAGSIQAVATVDEAYQIGAGKETLIAGERDGKPLPGFHLGNSPLEFTREKVEGKKVVSTTTNGTQAIVACKQADMILLACNRNALATANYLKARGQDVVLVPAGLYGRFALEDTWCGGYILSHFPTDVLLDGALAAMTLAKELSVTDLKLSKHGKYLYNCLGVGAEVDYCLALDTSSTLVQCEYPIITELVHNM